MHTTVRVAALALLALVPLAACGDDEPTTGTADTTSTSRVSSGTDGAGDGGTSDGGTSDGGAPVEVVGTVAAELDEPIVMIPKPDDDAVWVAERAGTIVRLEDDGSGGLVTTGDPVLDITHQTSTDAERGLLGMAFSNDGSVLYVSHTDVDGNSEVAAYDVDGDAVNASSRRELLSVEQPFPNHNGGNLVMTEDDELWLGLGDGGAADDPENRAQDPDTLLGKLIKVDTSGGGDHEIVASGLRNPWRFAFAPDGTIWIADVGQNQFEEINHLPVDDLTGANFGWSGYEGTEPYLDGDGRRPDDPVVPVHTYGREDGSCSITGGVVIEGADLGLAGAFLFSDYCGGRIQAIESTADGYEVRDLGIDVDSPISFGTDADGAVYVLSGSGSIVRIEPA